MAETGTDEQSDIERFDEMFANRYTDDDKQFMKTMSLSASKPPLVYPWVQNNFRRGDNRRQNHNDDDVLMVCSFVKKPDIHRVLKSGLKSGSEEKDDDRSGDKRWLFNFGKAGTTELPLTMPTLPTLQTLPTLPMLSTQSNNNGKAVEDFEKFYGSLEPSDTSSTSTSFEDLNTELFPKSRRHSGYELNGHSNRNYRYGVKRHRNTNYGYNLQSNTPSQYTYGTVTTPVSTMSTSSTTPTTFTEKFITKKTIDTKPKEKEPGFLENKDKETADLGDIFNQKPLFKSNGFGKDKVKKSVIKTNRERYY